ncbi:uncharacterized protein LOC141913840 [Tubulanus polymorphus]|uniref:uncharacterized protein LOC141913840 n=1 Tax=Tubulanus polymorphus TaxID=672921 RepID=UPI003DA615DF
MSCFLQEEGQDDDVSSEDNIITQLFNDGFTNKEICHSLETYFGLAMSERTLKRRLNKLGLKRRCNYQLHEVVSVVEEEVRGSGSCLGYRAMTSRLRNRYGIRVPRTVVSGVQHLIDPEGVRERASVPTSGTLAALNKLQICYFCEKGILKIARHLTGQQSTEAAVAKAIADTKENLNKTLKMLKLMGNFNHNNKVIANGGTDLVMEV